MGGKNWREEEKQFLQENYKEYKKLYGPKCIAELAKKLRRPKNSIATKIISLGLKGR